MEKKEYKVVYFSVRKFHTSSLSVNDFEISFHDDDALNELINRYATEGWAPISIGSGEYSTGYILLERICQPTKDRIS